MPRPSRLRRAATLVAVAIPLACATRGAPSTPAAAGPAATPAAAGPVATPAESAAPTARADRWQILLNSGAYLYEVRLVGERGDTLLAAQPTGPIEVPLDSIDELRLVQASSKVAGAGPGSAISPLTGVDDAVYKFSRYEPAERRRLAALLFRERASTDSAR